MNNDLNHLDHKADVAVDVLGCAVQFKIIDVVAANIGGGVGARRVFEFDDGLAIAAEADCRDLEFIGVGASNQALAEETLASNFDCKNLSVAFLNGDLDHIAFARMCWNGALS